MTPDDFRYRRAKPGKGAQRKAALFELRMAHTMLTHAIIGHVAGDPKGEEKKKDAQADIEAYTALLLEITHPPKPNEEFLLGDIAKDTS